MIAQTGFGIHPASRLAIPARAPGRSDMQPREADPAAQGMDVDSLSLARGEAPARPPGLGAADPEIALPPVPEEARPGRAASRSERHEELRLQARLAVLDRIGRVHDAVARDGAGPLQLQPVLDGLHRHYRSIAGTPAGPERPLSLPAPRPGLSASVVDDRRQLILAHVAEQKDEAMARIRGIRREVAAGSRAALFGEALDQLHDRYQRLGALELQVRQARSAPGGLASPGVHNSPAAPPDPLQEKLEIARRVLALHRPASEASPAPGGEAPPPTVALGASALGDLLRRYRTLAAPSRLGGSALAPIAPPPGGRLPADPAARRGLLLAHLDAQRDEVVRRLRVLVEAHRQDAAPSGTEASLDPLMERYRRLEELRSSLSRPTPR